MDEGSLGASIEESQDLHADAMRAVAPSLPALVEVRRERWKSNPVEVDTGESKGSTSVGGACWPPLGPDSRASARRSAAWAP